ncbi:hypothetical protein BKA57DRAFT_455484 [Linnemannia elongata]|nr:hypothetical protein BKA57DRAFT_455484 [Linnemannia elongata]
MAARRFSVLHLSLLLLASCLVSPFFIHPTPSLLNQADMRSGVKVKKALFLRYCLSNRTHSLPCLYAFPHTTLAYY